MAKPAGRFDPARPSWPKKRGPGRQDPGRPTPAGRRPVDHARPEDATGINPEKRQPIVRESPFLPPA